TEAGGVRVQIDCESGAKEVTAHVTVTRAGAAVQEETLTQPIRKPSEARFTGEPISISLKDAEIRDVLKTFAALTGVDIAVAPEVQGRVTISVADMPWDEALDQAINQVGAHYHVAGGKIFVTK